MRPLFLLLLIVAVSLSALAQKKCHNLLKMPHHNYTKGVTNVPELGHWLRYDDYTNQYWEISYVDTMSGPNQRTIHFKRYRKNGCNLELLYSNTLPINLYIHDFKIRHGKAYLLYRVDTTGQAAHYLRIGRINQSGIITKFKTLSQIVANPQPGDSSTNEWINLKDGADLFSAKLAIGESTVGAAYVTDFSIAFMQPADRNPYWMIHKLFAATVDTGLNNFIAKKCLERLDFAPNYEQAFPAYQKERSMLLRMQCDIEYQDGDNYVIGNTEIDSTAQPDPTTGLYFQYFLRMRKVNKNLQILSQPFIVNSVGIQNSFDIAQAGNNRYVVGYIPIKRNTNPLVRFFDNSGLLMQETSLPVRAGTSAKLVKRAQNYEFYSNTIQLEGNDNFLAVYNTQDVDTSYSTYLEYKNAGNKLSRGQLAIFSNLDPSQALALRHFEYVTNPSAQWPTSNNSTMASSPCNDLIVSNQLVVDANNTSSTKCGYYYRLFNPEQPQLLPRQQAACPNTGPIAFSLQDSVYRPRYFLRLANDSVVPLANIRSISSALPEGVHKLHMRDTLPSGCVLADSAVFEIVQPAITYESASPYLCSGDGAALKITVNTTHATIEWQVNYSGAFIPISSIPNSALRGKFRLVTPDSLRIINADSSLTGLQLRAVVKLANCQVVSNTFTLNGQLYTFLKTSSYFCSGFPAWLSVGAAKPGITYEWGYYTGSTWNPVGTDPRFSGQGTPTLNFLIVDPALVGTVFACKVVSTTCTSILQADTIKVTYTQGEASNNQRVIRVCEGDPVVLSSPVGTTPFTGCMWRSLDLTPNKLFYTCDATTYVTDDTRFVLSQQAGINCYRPDTVLVMVSKLQPTLIRAQRIGSCKYRPQEGNPPGFTQDSCWVACKKSTEWYYVDAQPNVSYNWSVTGGTIVQASSASVQIRWDSSGFRRLQVLLKDSAHCVVSAEQCFKLIDKPVARIGGSFTANQYNVAQVCAGAPIAFSDASLADPVSPIVSWRWDFGDGTYSSQQNPVKKFPDMGGATDYMVKLWVTNACGCSDSSYVLVRTSELAVPVELVCTGPVCADQVQTYEAIGDLSNMMLQWEVKNGTLLSSPPFSRNVSVSWNNGSTGPGVLTLKLIDMTTGTTPCSTGISAVIPILGPNMTIKGRAAVCGAETVEYSVDPVAGSLYTWSVTPSTAGSVSYSNNVCLIKWNGSASAATINLSMSHMIMDCAGGGSLVVKAGKLMDMNLPARSCQGSATPISIVNGSGSFTYNIYKGSQLVHTQTGTSINYTWPSAGRYSVEALSPTSGSVTYCNSPLVKLIDVAPPIAAPDTITGARQVCPGGLYEYAVPSVPGGMRVNWVVTGAAVYGSLLANPITVAFTPGVSWEVKAQFISEEPGSCASPLKAFAPTSLTPITLQALTGPTNACSGSTIMYQTPDYAEDYVWSISPSYLGSVKQGQGTKTVQIEWNNIVTGVSKATISMRATRCGQQSTKPLEVTLNDPAVSITASASSVCQGQFISFEVPGNPTLVEWLDLGQLGHVKAVGQSRLVSPVTAAPGTYVVHARATGVNGCNASKDVSTTVTVVDMPSFRLTATDYRDCYDLTYNFSAAWLRIHVMFGKQIVKNEFTFELQKDNGPVTQLDSTTWDSVQISGPGNYRVTVSRNGCTTSTSLEIKPCTITQTPRKPLCGISNLGTIYSTLDHNKLSGRFAFRLNNDAYDLGPIKWIIDYTQQSTDTVVNHTFTKAGIYEVEVIYKVKDNDTCEFRQKQRVYLPVIFGGSLKRQCDSAKFIDRSSYFDCSSKVVTARQYSTTVTLTAPHYYLPSFFDNSDSITITITPNPSCRTLNGALILGMPSYSFKAMKPTAPAVQINAQYGQICEGVPVQFSLGGATSQYTSVRWDLGDTAQSNLWNPVRTYRYNPVKADRDRDTLYIKAYLKSAGDTSECDVITYPLYLYRNKMTVTVLPEDAAICAGQSAELSIDAVNDFTPPYRALWSNNSTGNTTFAYRSGNYYVVVTDTLQCKAKSENIPVSTAQPPLPLIRGKRNLCYGESLELTAGLTGNYTFNWLMGGSTYGGASLSLSSLAAGTHYVRLQVTEPVTGCATTSDSVAVTVLPDIIKPVISADAICLETVVNLTVDNPVSGLTYYWSHGASGITARTFEGGYYRVMAMNSLGCTAFSDSIYIMGQPDISNIPYGCYEICDNRSVTLVANGLGLTTKVWNRYSGVPASFATANHTVGYAAGVYNFSGANACLDEQGLTVDSDTLTIKRTNACTASVCSLGVNYSQWHCSPDPEFTDVIGRKVSSICLQVEMTNNGTDSLFFQDASTDGYFLHLASAPYIAPSETVRWMLCLPWRQSGLEADPGYINLLEQLRSQTSEVILRLFNKAEVKNFCTFSLYPDPTDCADINILDRCVALDGTVVPVVNNLQCVSNMGNGQAFYQFELDMGMEHINTVSSGNYGYFLASNCPYPLSYTTSGNTLFGYVVLPSISEFYLWYYGVKLPYDPNALNYEACLDSVLLTPGNVACTGGEPEACNFGISNPQINTICPENHYLLQMDVYNANPALYYLDLNLGGAVSSFVLEPGKTTFISHIMPAFYPSSGPISLNFKPYNQVGFPTDTCTLTANFTVPGACADGARRGVLAEARPQQRFDLFPNPASQVLYLDYETSDETEWVLMHITGLVKERQVFAQPAGRLDIDLSQLPSGSYQLMLLPKGEKPVIKKFVIMR